MDSKKSVRTVVCPTCKGPSRYAPDNPYRPFCSERCSSVDFGAWASERYRVGAAAAEDADDAQAADRDEPGATH